MTSFGDVSIIGLGLIGSSIARAVRAHMPSVRLSGYDTDPAVLEIAQAMGLCDDHLDRLDLAVADADLVILCIPLGAMAAVAAQLAKCLPQSAIVSDVGSSKEEVVKALRAELPDATIVPAHPVAGTENSGPESGFATLFHGRWCILTPEPETAADPIARVRAFWEALGANVDLMTPRHHDLVLAVTSHVPHLIAYSIVGTASDLEKVTRSEVIKYSAGGFRDFTRIAASNPTMWRDVFLSNRDAVLEILQRLTEDIMGLQRAIRWGDGDQLFDTFTRTQAIRRSVVMSGQDDPTPDFGRTQSHDAACPSPRTVSSDRQRAIPSPTL